MIYRLVPLIASSISISSPTSNMPPLRTGLDTFFADVVDVGGEVVADNGTGNGRE